MSAYTIATCMFGLNMRAKICCVSFVVFAPLYVANTQLSAR